MELEYIIKVVAPYLIHSLELIGMFIIAVGTVKSFYKYLKTIANPDKNKISRALRLSKTAKANMEV